MNQPSGSRKRSSSQTDPPMDESIAKHTILEEASNDLDDAAHTRQDKLVLDWFEQEQEQDFSSRDILGAIVTFSEGKLNPKFEKITEQGLLLRDHPELVGKLKEARAARSFKEIRNLKILRLPTSASVESRLRRSPPLERETERLKAAHKAFSDKWLGNSHLLLADLMNRLRKPPDDPLKSPYNHSISIIQSSGMGKSRLVDAVAEEKFCFPFNVREPASRSLIAYPPADDCVRDFFHEPKYREPNDDGLIERRYKTFFAALFLCAASELRVTLNQTQHSEGSIAKRWHNYLASGATEWRVGAARSKFYQKVVDVAEKFFQGGTASEDVDSMLADNAGSFMTSLREALVSSKHSFDSERLKEPVLFFMYFDEAHVLTKSEAKPGQSPPRSRYHLLGRVLAKMNDLPFFTVFLSTNSWLGAFAPSKSNHQTLRDWNRVILHAPFTELPFDTFASNSFATLLEAYPSGVTLHNVCTLEYIVKFGRPLWASLYTCGAGEVKSEMIDLAKVKLSCGDVAAENARIAALSVRIMLDFDIARETSRIFEEKLVESHLRIAFAVPDHREFLRGGTPSEPLVAEAAAQILNTDPHIQIVAPTILTKLFEGGLLARGERGEMIGRLLWMIGHDLVIQNDTADTINNPSNPRYHRPILLLDWLRALINPRWHHTILNAKPVANTDGPTLECAFRGVYLNFSQFVRAGDYGVIRPNLQWIPLVRGVAYQCADNQKSTDLFATMHFGGLDAPICPANSGPLFGQIKNRATLSDVLLNPHVGGTPVNQHPILSLVHDIGLETPKVYPHAPYPAKKLRGGDTRTENIHLRHYQIHIEGCTHETYAVVPREMDGVYRSIICASTIIDDFPRNGLEAHRKAMLCLKPAFFSTEPSLDWISEAPLDELAAAQAGSAKGKERET